MHLGTIFGLALTLVAAPQTSAPSDRFQAFQFFLGSWEGEGQGRPGKSQVSREYQLVLDGRFIEIHNRSLYSETRLRRVTR